MLSKGTKLVVHVVLLLVATSWVVAGCPDVRVELSEEVEFCEVCREHSMDGWRVNLRVENRTTRATYVLGDWIPSYDGNKWGEPNKFLLTTFEEITITDAAGRESDNSDTIPNRKYLEKRMIYPSEVFEWRPVLGWNFDYKQVRRISLLAGFESDPEPCVISSSPFFIERNGGTEGRLVTVR